MLKRYQVLLDDWMAEHYQLMAKKHDVSFSEMIRMGLCSDILQATSVTFPKYKSKIDWDKLKKTMQAKDINEVMEKIEFHEFLSQVYFEARKSTELWTK
ncbi:MAG: hypothetical protein JW800_03140 [Candidatus Omnitrophica bacterium]|nr:hypothetical protein [Candidatus Omnitrophota bacterium]